MKTVTTTEAKAKLHALLDDVSEGRSVTITRHGRAVAVLHAPEPEASVRTFGRFAGRIEVQDNFDDPLDDEELALWEPGS